MTDQEKKALNIAYVNDKDLTIRDSRRTIDFYKYDDGDVELQMEETADRNIYIFKKEQIDFLIKWLTNSNNHAK